MITTGRNEGVWILVMQNNVNYINPSQPFTCTVFLNLKLSIYVILSLKKHSLLHIWAETPDNQLLRCEGFAFSSLHTASQAFTLTFPKIACLFNTIWLFGGDCLLMTGLFLKVIAFHLFPLLPGSGGHRQAGFSVNGWKIKPSHFKPLILTRKRGLCERVNGFFEIKNTYIAHVRSSAYSIISCLPSTFRPLFYARKQ